MAYVFRQGDLPKLDLQIDRGTDFAAWRAQWEAYATLSGLDKEAPDRQVKALTLCFSRETLTVVDNLGLSEDQRGKATKIIDAIQRYVEGHVNESVERRNFRRRVQHPGESFDDFLVSLRELAKTCKFCDNECMEKNIRDQIIEGIHDGDTIQNLLQEKDLSLPKAITMCQAQEAAKKNRAEMARYTSDGIQALDSARYDRGGSSDPPSAQAVEQGSTLVAEGSVLPTDKSASYVRRGATLQRSAVGGKSTNHSQSDHPGKGGHQECGHPTYESLPSSARHRRLSSTSPHPMGQPQLQLYQIQEQISQLRVLSSWHY